MRGGFVFFFFYLFRMNHQKIIVNYRKIIKWKINFCWTPYERTYNMVCYSTKFCKVKSPSKSQQRVTSISHRMATRLPVRVQARIIRPSTRPLSPRLRRAIDRGPTAPAAMPMPLPAASASPPTIVVPSSERDATGHGAGRRRLVHAAAPAQQTTDTANNLPMRGLAT